MIRSERLRTFLAIVLLTLVPGVAHAQQEGQGEAEADHAAEVAGAEHAEASETPDIGGMITHHLVDAAELELPFVGYVHLPTFPPLHIGPVTIDLSPSKHVVFLLLAALLCAVLFISVARAIERKYVHEAPSGFANAIEATIVYFRDAVCKMNIGHGYEPYVPFVLTLFFFILTMNLLGLVPFGATSTGNINVTASLAILTFIVVEVTGFRTLGPGGYARTIFYAPEGLNPFARALMLVIMTPVEFLGKLTKPFALAIRLFANMTAGHTLILSLIGVIFIFGNLGLGRWAIAGSSIGLSTAIMILEVFVAFLQAYIFAMLTSVFIGLIRHAH